MNDPRVISVQKVHNDQNDPPKLKKKKKKKAKPNTVRPKCLNPWTCLIPDPERIKSALTQPLHFFFKVIRIKNDHCTEEEIVFACNNLSRQTLWI